MKRRIIPHLTAGKISELLGENLSQIVYYDYTTKKWGLSQYQGFDILYQNSLDGMFANFRKILEKEPVFAGRYLMANVYKTTDATQFSGLHTFQKNVPTTMGNCVAGNQITYNTKTGMFESIPGGWFYAMRASSPSAAANLGMEYFAEAIMMSPEIRRQFLTGYQNTK